MHTLKVMLLKIDCPTILLHLGHVSSSLPFSLGIAGATSSRMKFAIFELHMESVTSHICCVDNLD